jgi:hypothetical protein
LKRSWLRGTGKLTDTKINHSTKLFLRKCSFLALEGKQIVGTAVCKVATLAESTGTIHNKNSGPEEMEKASNDDITDEDEFPAKFKQLDQFFTDLGTDYGQLNVFHKVR